MAPFFGRAEKYGRFGKKELPPEEKSPGKLFTLQRTAVFSDILSLGAIAGKTGNVTSGNSRHSVSTLSTSSSRSRVFNTDKICSFSGWGLRWGEYAGSLPVQRNASKHAAYEEEQGGARAPSTGPRPSQRATRTKHKNSFFDNDPGVAQGNEQKKSIQISRQRRRRVAITGFGQSKLQVRSAVRLWGRAHMDKFCKLRQITDMTFDEEEETEMSMADMVKAAQQKTGLAKEEIEELSKLFQKYDKDGSGMLNNFEVKKVLADFGLEPKTREERTEINELLIESDKDETGEFNFMEFVLILVKIRAKLKELQLAELQKKFMEADQDGSGDLDMSEVMRILKQIGFEPRTEEEQTYVSKVVEENDADGSGEVSFDEFQKLVSQVRSGLALTRRKAEVRIKAEHGIDDELFQAFRPELQTLLENFKRYDRDGSGQLDHDESFMVLSDAGLLPRTRTERIEIQEMMQTLDIEGNGQFSFGEFLDMTYRIRRMMVEREEAQLYGLFQQYDADQSGELGSLEIFKILEDFKMLPKTRAEQDEIKAVLEEVDQDGSGNLEFKEFQILMQKVRQNLQKLEKDNDRAIARELGFSDEQTKDFRKAFEKLDPDGTNSLSITEIRQVLRLLHTNLSGDELRAIFDSLDEDGSGSLDFGEFLNFMKLAEEGKEKMRQSVSRMGTSRRSSSFLDAP